MQIITKRNVAAGHSYAARLVSLLVLGAAGCIGVDDLEVCVGRGCVPRAGAAGEGSGGASGGAAGGQGSGASASDAGVEPPDDSAPDAAVDAGAPTDPAGEPCQIAFISPVPDDSGDARLLAADDIDETACGLTFTTSVALDTNASSVRLFVNDNPVGVQPVSAGAAVFAVVLGNRQDTPNALSAEAIMPDGTTCSATFGGDVLVDCLGPSCSVTSPLATRAGFLSSTHDADPASAGVETDILVETEPEHAGQVVRLAIDGLLDVVAGESVEITGGVGRATFGAVTLDEGLRTIRAECEDADGAVTASAAIAWDVDVTTCGLALEALAGGADPLTAIHDLDSDPSNGLQLQLRGDVTGDDCRSVGFGVCGLTLAEVELAGLPGDGSFSAPITLAHQTGVVELCAEVEDLAGNRSDPQVTLSANVRSSAPEVAITFPTSGARLNVAGTAGGIADAEPSSAATCETNVSVDCTDVGRPVELLVNGSLAAVAACAPLGGLEPPFAGRATFAGVSLPTQNDGVSTAALSARQNLAGLTGVSTEIVVQADCEAPSCDITRPAFGAVLNAADDTSSEPDLQTTVEVRSDLGSVGQNVRLTLDGDEVSSLLSTAVAAGNGATATFLDVTFVDIVHSAQAQCQDVAGNVQTSATETWSIDATPCTATLTVAGGVEPITPASDLEGGTGGLQVTVTGHALETDCASVRVAVCGAAPGAFTPLDGAGNFTLGVTLDAVTASFEVCAEITDDAGNIGTSRAPVSVRVDAPIVQIVSPLAGARFDEGTGCDAGVAVTCPDIGDAVELFVDGVLVDEQPCIAPGIGVFSILLDSKHDGSPTELSARQTADGLVGPFSTLTVQADCEPPAPVGPLTVNVTGRREGTLDLSWSSVLDTDGAPLAAYRLRCATTDITNELTWGTATDIPVALTPSTTPGTTETVGLTDVRTGTSRFCVVRGEAENGQLSAISSGLTSIVANPFRQQPYTIRDDANNINTVGNVVVEPLGDINGDAIDDFMYGALNANIGGAQVFFGTTTLDPEVAETADITINRTGTASGFGGEATGLGDISGDGLPDFAVSARLGGANTVYVFFGRADTAPAFPATIDAAGAACPTGVDLCVVGSAVPTGGGLFSWDVHGANFDGSGVNDLVISARTATSVALGAGRVYVLLGGAQLAAATNRIVTIPANAVTTLNEVDGFIIDPPAARAHFGFSVTALDNAGADDLIIGANGQPPVGAAAAVGAVYHLAGRAYPAAAGSGLISIDSTELDEIESGLLANFGNPVRAVGDFDGDGAGDFAMGHNYVSFGAVRVYLRSGSAGTFSSSSVLNFLPLGDGNDDNYGLYMANGQYPDLGLLGDLDNDGLGELLIGADDPDGSGATAFGVAQLFYGAVNAVGRARSTADFAYTSTRGQVVPNFVGDINADGFNDVALLDSGFGANTLLLLY